MEPLLAKQFQDLERRKARFLADLNRLPPAALAARPTLQGWSALQVLDHICRTEEGIFEAMRSATESRPVRARDRLNALALNAFFRLPVRVRAPGPVSQIMPAAAPELPELTRRWAALRLNMEDWLECLAAADCRAGRFRHPVAGWMSVPTTLGFLRAHLHHHGYQLNRIRRAAGMNPPRSR
jgi:hypothetical protein